MFANCTDSSRCAGQVFYKMRTAEEDLQGPPSDPQEERTLAWDEDLLPYLRFFPCLSWMSLKWTQAVPLCQKHCVIFYVVVVAVKL